MKATSLLASEWKGHFEMYQISQYIVVFDNNLNVAAKATKALLIVKIAVRFK